MNWKQIKTKKDYQEALNRLEVIFDSARATQTGGELEVLGVLIDQYENEHFPIDPPNPSEVIKFRTEQFAC